ETLAARLDRALATHPEVVDLLVVRERAWRVVVLVRRIGGPVPCRREHLDGDQPVDLVERAGREEIGHLSCRLSCAANLDGHPGRRDMGGLEPSLRTR